MDGTALRWSTEDRKTMAEYGFKAGGAMLIFTLVRKIEVAAASQPTTGWVAAQPVAAAENK